MKVFSLICDGPNHFLINRKNDDVDFTDIIIAIMGLVIILEAIFILKFTIHRQETDQPNESKKAILNWSITAV